MFSSDGSSQLELVNLASLLKMEGKRSREAQEFQESGSHPNYGQVEAKVRSTLDDQMTFRPGSIKLVDLYISASWFLTSH